MYLKSVEVNGFKSFAEKVKVDFDTGITSIVGPNGSGKSNILDATLWVLGEQSYKNIRAKESTDVIFSGGKNRKPKNSAEVSLYIDNSDRTLPMEEDNVKITRKLHRTGENEYLINNSKARLKDINELFMDTGVGKSAYSVIGQGKVERIISSSSKEIRGIIEEAAGIKKVKVRKAEAEKKLEKVEAEVEKIDLILGELEDNKVKIERQAGKALKYRELSEEKNVLAKGINEIELAQAVRSIGELEGRIAKLREDIASDQEAFEEAEKRLEELNNSRERLSEEIETLSQSNVDLKRDIDKIVNDRTLFTERKKSYGRELEEKKEVLAAAGERTALKRKLIDEIEVKIELLTEEIVDQEKENRTFDTVIEEKSKEKRDLEIELNIKKDKLMTYEVDRLKYMTDMENNVKRMKSSRSKISELQGEVEEYRKKVGENKEEKAKQAKLLSQREEEYNGIDGRLEVLEEAVGSISQEMNRAYEVMREADYNLKRHGGKLENLMKLEANNEGFYKGVKEVLNSNIEGVEGAFISLVTIPEEYERAIEAAIPGNLQDIIVKDSNVAKRCIGLLKERRAGRASFLALDTVRSAKKAVKPNEPGVVGIGSDLLEFDPQYERVVDMLLGNLLIVDKMDTAVRISKRNLHRGNIVTLHGELVSSRGRITGGENLRSVSSQIFERKKEIKNLEAIVAEHKKKYSISEKKYGELSQKMEATEEKLVALDDLKETLKTQVKRDKELLEDISRAGDKLLKNLRTLELEEREENLYISEYMELEKNAKDNRAKVEDLMEELRQEIQQGGEQITKCREEVEALKDDFSDKRIRFLNNRETLKQTEREAERQREELKEVESGRKAVEKRIGELTGGIEELEGKLKALEESYTDENVRYQKEFLEIKEKRNEYSLIEKEERETIKRVKDIENKIVLGNNKLGNLLENHEKQSLRRGKLEAVREELKDVEQGAQIEDLAASKEELLKLEARIKNLGVVNLLAIEEFEEVKKKFEFIGNQRRDLMESEKALRELIKDIENVVEMRFLEAYESINENFGYMCREILSNSEGRLELSDSTNILETGIELMVKFKNKKRQSITLLSGGEKSMVAVAFIMGIFMYKPSPFTFFDEIEAALDEANTKRLIGKLKEFTDRSQFILITHNKETMRESDTLYGVTMNKEIGESKILSVRM